jgi:hypothetical protein
MAISYALWISNRGGYRPATGAALFFNSVTVDSSGKAGCLRARSLPIKLDMGALSFVCGRTAGAKYHVTIKTGAASSTVISPDAFPINDNDNVTVTAHRRCDVFW